MTNILNEDQIERKVERMVNALDKVFMNGEITQADYDNEMKFIDEWAREQYKATENYERLTGRID